MDAYIHRGMRIVGFAGSFVCLSLILFLSPVYAAEFKKGDGKLSFYNYHLNEVLDVRYRTGEKYDRSAIEKINHLFRSRSDDKEIDIDINLIELLDNIQDHFGADCLELISGYRSPELNGQLKKSGINVSDESMHLVGKAADIHIDEVTEETLSAYARSLGVGGVGYYPANDFVHVDTGDVRNWDLPDKTGRLLVALRKGDEWQVMTDKDIYFDNQKIKFGITNITRSNRDMNVKMRLDFYGRGEWKKDSDIIVPKNGANISSDEICWSELPMPKKFGKYRIVITGPSGHEEYESRSNEFYVKKK